MSGWAANAEDRWDRDLSVSLYSRYSYQVYYKKVCYLAMPFHPLHTHAYSIWVSMQSANRSYTKVRGFP